MSTNATFGQAGHTLTIIGQQEPNTDHLKVLHNGYLADLMRAIKNGSLPNRQDFQKILGLLPEFKIWKTITLRVFENADAIRSAVFAGGNRISNPADDILNKMLLVKNEETFELVVASVAELGLEDGATTREIFERARGLGLDLCPAQVGPELRIAYEDQPKGEWLLVAMEQIAGSDGLPGVLVVGHDGGERWLYAACAFSECRWVAGGRWVFVRCK
ncbi:MAG: hypothetical protein AAB584_00075 [Patescibacteria group bacterium]